MSHNGEAKFNPTLKNPPVQFDLVIRWTPETYQIAVAWPPLDDVTLLGILEFAKLTLIERRISAAGSKIEVPRIAIPTRLT